MPRLMAFAKTWEAFKDGSKIVTRRSTWIPKGVMDAGYWVPGWQKLKPEDVIEGVEWTPRWQPNGERWTCAVCGWLGPTDPSMTVAVQYERDKRHESDARSSPHKISPVWRGPTRLPSTDGHRRIVSVRDEMLYDITPEDVELEGFPGRAPQCFHAMYCGWKSMSNRPVNRIEFEEI